MEKYAENFDSKMEQLYYHSEAEFSPVRNITTWKSNKKLNCTKIYIKERKITPQFLFNIKSLCECELPFPILYVYSEKESFT